MLATERSSPQVPKVANDALDTVLGFLARHEVIRSKAEQSPREVVRLCERSIIYGLATQSGKDVSFYMRGIGSEALVTTFNTSITSIR